MLKTAVTSERVRRALVLLAFWDDSPGGINTQGIPERERQIVREGDGVIKRIMRPVDYAPLDEQERGELQSSILRCRWCTLDRILGLLPDLMNLNIQRNWVNAVTMDEGQRGALGRFLGREKKGDAREFEGVDANNRRWRLFVVPLVSITMSCEETGEVRIRRVLGVKDIPEKLLRGDKGFGEEECVLLELLRIAAGFDQSEHLEAKVTLSREALQQGIHAALIEHNTRALITVLKMDEYFARSQNVNLSDPPLYTIPAEHFRTAIRVAPSDPTLFQLLLRTSAESIPGNDPDLTQWAMDLASPLGNWILDFMLASRQQREAARTNPVEGSVFYFGRANVQGDLARRYLDEVLGVQELGSWVGETSFDVSGLWRVGED